VGADNAGERRDDIGIVEIDRRDLGVGLRLLQVGLRVIARERRFREGFLEKAF
jgi:hypothetical protein